MDLILVWEICKASFNSFCFLVTFDYEGYIETIPFIILTIVLMLIIILLFILMAAFLTLYERQTLAAIQRRKGPNIVGFMGLLQAFADAFKLLFKEQSAPITSARVFFIGSSLYVVLFSLFVWAVIPLGYGAVIADLGDVAFLYLISISSISVYGIIVAGWSSNSRYPFLGALRACAQMLAYELVISVILLQIFLFTGSLNITEVVMAQKEIYNGWFLFTSGPLAVIWFICTLAETYRAPFDLAEAESELVSGFNVEYSSMTFAFLFLGEYLHVIVMSNLFVIIFLGGWLPIPLISCIFPEFWNMVPGLIWYCLKLWFVIFSFIWVRATFPRFRYDQLMALGWKILLPLTCALLVVSVFFIVILSPVVAY
jgi:NADH:ubiquinone oxidoreductase subunit 1 (chain H)